MRRFAQVLTLVGVCAASVALAAIQDRPRSTQEKRQEIDRILHSAEYRNIMVRRHYVARCPECADLASRINELSRLHQELFERSTALHKEDQQLGQEFTVADAAFREARSRGNNEAAAKARARLDEIVARRVEISRLLFANAEQFTDVGFELFNKIIEIEECEARCFSPAGQGGPGGDPGSGGTAPDLTVTAIPNSPGAECKDCQNIADLLAGTRAAIDRAYDYMGGLSDQIEKLDGDIDKMARERAEVQRQVAAGDASLQSQLTGLEAAWRSAGAHADALKREAMRIRPIATMLIDQAIALDEKLRRCNFDICRKGKFSWEMPPTGDGAGTAGSSGTASGCQDCAGLPERIAAMQDQQADVGERLDSINRNIKDVEALKANAKGDQAGVLDGQLEILKRHRGEAEQQQQLNARELGELNERLKGCKPCGTSTTPNTTQNTTGDAPAPGPPGNPEPPPPPPPPSPPTAPLGNPPPSTPISTPLNVPLAGVAADPCDCIALARELASLRGALQQARARHDSLESLSFVLTTGRSEIQQEVVGLRGRVIDLEKQVATARQLLEDCIKKCGTTLFDEVLVHDGFNNWNEVAECEACKPAAIKVADLNRDVHRLTAERDRQKSRANTNGLAFNIAGQKESLAKGQPDEAARMKEVERERERARQDQQEIMLETHRLEQEIAAKTTELNAARQELHHCNKTRCRTATANGTGDEPTGVDGPRERLIKVDPVTLKAACDACAAAEKLLRDAHRDLTEQAERANARQTGFEYVEELQAKVKGLEDALRQCNETRCSGRSTTEPAGDVAPPHAADPPTHNLLDSSLWNTAGDADVEPRTQIKMGDLVLEIVVRPVQAPQVRDWFNPLGLLARRLADNLERWRGSMGPRPLINPRDLQRVEAYTNGQGAGLPKGLHVLLTDRGGSTGKTLGMQVLNLTGQPVRLRSMPFVIEPVRQQVNGRVQQAFTRLAKAAPINLDLAGYCLEFLKQPPGPNTIFRLAPAAVQQKFQSMSGVLQAASRVQQAGLLRPDSDPAAYADAIKQWALWAVEQNFNESRFTSAFLGHTRKNVEAAGRPWPKDGDAAIRKVSPNRWRDIVQILSGAGLPVPE